MTFELPAKLDGKKCTVEIDYSLLKGVTLTITRNSDGEEFILKAKRGDLMALYREVKAEFGF